MHRYSWFFIIVISYGLFILSGKLSKLPAPKMPVLEDRVVITAPIQLMLSGGDRFLAADIETIRSAVSGPTDGIADTLYRIRAHQAASQLNPCHEDNYYLGSILLTWGGAVAEGSQILQHATACRQWDYLPPFLYGFNQYFFHNNHGEAQSAFELAAQRSPENYAALKKISIMIAAGELKNDRSALHYLKQQHGQTTDKKLRLMLEKRIARLEGLILLRDAQKQFETVFKRPLENPNELITSKIIDSFPFDPLGIGYEFRDGMFILHQLTIQGLEEKK